MKKINKTASGWITTVLILTVAPVGAQVNTAAKNLLEEARRLESESSFAEADDSYEMVLDRYPESPQAQEAILALANSRIRADEPDEALARLEQLISTHPESPNAATASVLQASITRRGARSIADLKAAQTLLSRVPLLYGPEKFETLDARVESRVRRGEIRLLLGQPQLAALDFLQAIEDEPPSRWLPRARLGLADSLLDQGDWTAAAEILQRVVDSESDESTGAARRLTFLHRHWLRPSLGLSPWESARPLGGEWKKPSIIAASSDGRLLVFDSGTNLLSILGSDREIEKRTETKTVRDLWWGADDTAYRATAEGARSLDGSPTANFNVQGADKRQATKNLVAGGRGLFGHWLAIDRGQSALMAYSSAEGSRFFKSVPGQDPVDLAFDHRSQILVLDRKTARVSRLNLDLESVGSPLSDSWKRAERIASDAAGNVYVLDTAENRIDLFDRDGEDRGSVGPSLPGGIRLRGAADLSVDGEGRLYIVDSKLQQVIVLE